MRILLINQDWFKGELQSLGHEVRTAGPRPSFDFYSVSFLSPIEGVLNTFDDGWRPEAIVVFDDSAPLKYTGLDQLEIPTLFYSVDTHHHWEWHKYLAHAFHNVFVAQKDLIPQMESTGASAEWLPLYVSETVKLGQERTRDAVFVGTLNAQLNPSRVEFFQRLQKLVPVEVMQTQWQQVFPYSQVVINQTVRGDLNFRVFEALASGALLLTERSGNGLLDLFSPDEHLVVYERGNAEEAAALIRSLLSDKVRMRRISEAGYAEVMARHLPIHRAHVIDQALRTPRSTRGPMAFFGMALNFLNLARGLQGFDPAGTIQSLVGFGKAAQLGVNRREPLVNELAYALVVGAVVFDRYTKGATGANLLRQCYETYPEFPVFQLGAMRSFTQLGATQQAMCLAQEFGGHEPSTVLLEADKVVNALLDALFTPYPEA